MWYLVICSKHNPKGFVKHGPVPIIIEKDDIDILPWLCQSVLSPMINYLYNLEYYIRCDLRNLIHNLIVLYKVNKYGVGLNFHSIHLHIKVVGMISKIIIGSVTVNLDDITEPLHHFDKSTEIAWKNQIFFMVCAMLKREYFDNFLEIHEELDQKFSYN